MSSGQLPNAILAIKVTERLYLNMLIGFPFFLSVSLNKAGLEVCIYILRLSNALSSFGSSLSFL